MKRKLLTLRCIMTVGFVIVAVIFGLALVMHCHSFDNTILRVSCLAPSVHAPCARYYVNFKDLPESIGKKITQILNEDSVMAIADINSYCYSKAIIVRGEKYKVYLFKDFTVYEGEWLWGQYSAPAKETHQLCYGELREYIVNNGIKH